VGSAQWQEGSPRRAWAAVQKLEPTAGLHHTPWARRVAAEIVGPLAVANVGPARNWKEHISDERGRAAQAEARNVDHSLRFCRENVGHGLLHDVCACPWRLADTADNHIDAWQGRMREERSVRRSMHRRLSSCASSLAAKSLTASSEVLSPRITMSRSCFNCTFVGVRASATIVCPRERASVAKRWPTPPVMPRSPTFIDLIGKAKARRLSDAESSHHAFMHMRPQRVPHSAFLSALHICVSA
jgi:hypothetical protein